ncbi:uncharacterized protein LOC105837357 [Monomorium pharaonis]|uniref:uncharacterized protein LOC105837357 n=1 Tax=Monomorium pharaonis TaxID=307658 RepID=UPI001747072D|nr:uncharacterized protein LOC105837357 [Monomorium pharaonis]
MVHSFIRFCLAFVVVTITVSQNKSETVQSQVVRQVVEKGQVNNFVKVAKRVLELLQKKNNVILKRFSHIAKNLFLLQLIIYVLVLNHWIKTITCDKTICPGPLAYYEDLNCTPVYEQESGCCPIRYNCDHLKERSPTKCYINDHEYEIGEKLKNGDATPCDDNCYCQLNSNNIATFKCTPVVCSNNGTVKPGCYRRNTALNCCPGEEVCLENSEDRAVCNVDGKEYRDGESFTIESENLNCVCQPGYEGKNVLPFCRKRKSHCNPDFYNATYIIKNCAPIYHSTQSPQTSCNVDWLCQNNNDTVVHVHKDDLKSVIDRQIAENSVNDENVCLFGNMIMHRGDKLKQGNHSKCLSCVCEVPPVLTCQRLIDEECNSSFVTNSLRICQENGYCTHWFVKLVQSFLHWIYWFLHERQH